MATRWTSKHTGQKIDDTIDYVCNPNLLDNCYFGNPVDQRGGHVVPPGTKYFVLNTSTLAGTTSTYVKVDNFNTSGLPIITINGTQYNTNTSAAIRGYTEVEYTIDRWYCRISQTILVTDGGIKVVANTDGGSFCQYLSTASHQEVLNELKGKTVTLSALFLDGELITNSVTLPLSVTKNYNFGTVEKSDKTCAIYLRWYTDDRLIFDVYSLPNRTNDYTPIAVKLELGTEQTLAHQDMDGNWVLNEIPDYGEQLRRCQRHQLRVGYKEGSTYSPVLTTGVAVSSASIRALIPTPVTMRENPVISFFGNDTISTIHAIGNGVSLTPTAIDARVNSNGIFLNLTVSGATVNETYAITLDHARGLMLDANL